MTAKSSIQHGTIIEITNTGFVLVELDDGVTQHLMITSDFPSYPRLSQRVELETCFGHTKARALSHPVARAYA